MVSKKSKTFWKPLNQIQTLRAGWIFNFWQIKATLWAEEGQKSYHALALAIKVHFLHSTIHMEAHQASQFFLLNLEGSFNTFIVL